MKRIILKCLDPNPEQRPTFYELYISLMQLLEEFNPIVKRDLEVKFKWYDELAMKSEKLNTFFPVLQLSKISKDELNIQIKDLCERISSLEYIYQYEGSPEVVADILRAQLLLSTLHIERNGGQDIQKSAALIIKMAKFAIKNRHLLKSEIIYGKEMAEISEFEVLSDYFYKAICALQKIEDKSSLIELIKICKNNNDTLSAFLYAKAIMSHFSGDENKALSSIEKAIKLNPEERVLKQIKDL
jgi:tetratricopeptide (TPR) repeat protein